MERGREPPLLSSPIDLQTRGGLSRGGLNRGNPPPPAAPLKVIHPSLTRSHPQSEEARPVRGCGACSGAVPGVRGILEPRRGTRNSGGPGLRKLRNSSARSNPHHSQRQLQAPRQQIERNRDVQWGLRCLHSITSSPQRPGNHPLGHH